ncbi:MAG TPA: VWA domain-containing protein, partial [Aggregatilineales bacterium]|nr:VWA domain-containing protein [Aggregatilineales bacterium]
MQADFVLDYDVLKANIAQKIYLMARVVSGEAVHHQKRRPLNLSLVIDRSGSMAGDKIDYTRQAAQFLVQNLGVNDTLSIVLYNDTVETLLLPEKVQRKDAISQKIAEIKPSGTTNLSSGWLEGCKLVTQELNSSNVNRVILMSDGLANRGVTDKSQLVTMAQQKFGEGVSTTTMGLGNDFNEDLLMEMASSGGGAFYFIESPEVTPQIFQEELQGLLNVVAQNLVIGILPSDGVNIAGQLNAYAMKFDGAYTTFRLGDVFADEIKAIVIELTLPPLSEGAHKIVNLRFEYDELRDNNTTQHHVVELPVMIRTTSQQNAIVVKNSVVNQNVLLLQAANARKTAVQLADRGAFNEASQILRNAALLIDGQNDNNPK